MNGGAALDENDERAVLADQLTGLKAKLRAIENRLRQIGGTTGPETKEP
jgi:hypothetical protein